MALCYTHPDLALCCWAWSRLSPSLCFPSQAVSLRAARGAPSVSQSLEWLAQVWVLAIRNCRMYIRNPELLGAKLVTYICMGAFMGAPPLQLSIAA